MVSDYTQMKENELHTALTEKRSELREQRFDLAGTKSSNPNEKRQTKRDIARILTELNRRSA